MAQRVRAIGQQGLFYDVMKHLLDETILRLLAADRIFGDVVRAREANLLAVIGDVFADRIDWPIMLAAPEAAHGIKLLEAEAKWIDHGMATLARLRLRQLRDFFAHRQIGRKVGVLECHGHRRRLERAADNVSREENAAMAMTFKDADFECH